MRTGYVAGGFADEGRDHPHAALHRHAGRGRRGFGFRQTMSALRSGEGELTQEGPAGLSQVRPRQDGDGLMDLSIRERLAAYVREQARWRRNKAPKYPDDTRYLRS